MVNWVSLPSVTLDSTAAMDTVRSRVDSLAVSDHGLFPSALVAWTCTSYDVLTVRPFRFLAVELDPWMISVHSWVPVSRY